MTPGALDIVRVLFTSIWSLFTSWKIPGTGATPAAVAIFFLFAAVGIRIVRFVFTSNTGSPADTFARFDRSDKIRGKGKYADKG